VTFIFCERKTDITECCLALYRGLGRHKPLSFKLSANNEMALILPTRYSLPEVGALETVVQRLGGGVLTAPCRPISCFKDKLIFLPRQLTKLHLNASPLLARPIPECQPDPALHSLVNKFRHAGCQREFDMRCEQSYE